MRCSCSYFSIRQKRSIQIRSRISADFRQASQIFFRHALGYIWRRHFKNTEKAGNSNILQLQQRATTAAELLTAAATEKKLQLQH